MITTQRLLTLLLSVWIGQTLDATDRPNVLLIVADDLGFSDLGCYGGEIDTPNLDALASKGTRLTQFYTTARCCPSRACLLTGQYPHRVGLGHMTKDIDRPGYRGRVSADARNIAQRLNEVGYRSFLSGKWHLGTNDPTRHGFEEFYGTLVSAKTFWDADHFIRLPAGRQKVASEGRFYATDAVTDHALSFLNRAHDDEDSPWFLYLPFNAPHFPLQAPKALIDKYVDRYSVGWDRLRQRRLDRMKYLGLVGPTMSLTPRSRHFDWGEAESTATPAWDSLPAARRKDLSRRMAIYAAMIDSMDQNIGRILSRVDDLGELDRTLIIFTSDNGACAEWDELGFDGKSGPDNHLHRGEALDKMGGPGTFHSVGAGWAGASNTPWRWYKHHVHEGGVSVPFIIRLPSTVASVPDGGTIRQQPSHLIDIMPTVLDTAGIDVDAVKAADDLPGNSLLPVIKSNAPITRILYFEHEGNRAVRKGRWKLVANRDRPWELFDLDNDRGETTDLAEHHPDVVASLSAAWDTWADENQVTPLPDDYQVEYLPKRTVK